MNVRKESTAALSSSDVRGVPTSIDRNCMIVSLRQDFDNNEVVRVQITSWPVEMSIPRRATCSRARVSVNAHAPEVARSGICEADPILYQVENYEAHFSVTQRYTHCDSPSC